MEHPEKTGVVANIANGGNGDEGVASGSPEHESVASQKPRVVVVGCSGHARVVVDILEAARRCHIVGLLDSLKPPGSEVLGYQVIGSDDDLPALVAANICDAVIVGIGDNWVRSRMVTRIKRMVPKIHFVTAVHPSAQIARYCSIGAGTVVMAGVVVNPGCEIGEFSILNTGSSLDHDSRMGQFSSLAPRAVTGGGVRIGDFSAIAIGAVISHSIAVGDHTVVGAGATVLKDVPDRVVVYGTPARVIRSRNPGDSYLGEPSNRSNGASQAPAIVNSAKSLTIVPASSAEWGDYLDRAPHDFFHTANYHQIAECFGRGRAWLAVYGSREKFVAWPYLVQEIEGFERTSAESLRDITSVYGYSGPVACGCEQEEAFLSAAWRALVETWRSQSVVSVFTRLHPLLGNHRWLRHLRNDGGASELVDEGRGEGTTVAVDLRASPEEIWHSYKRQLRQALRRLMSLSMTTTSDPDWACFDDFVRLYYKTMKRNGSASFYLFPGRQFKQLKSALGPHGSLMVTRYEGEIAAAALLIEYSGIVNVHLLATDDRFAHLSPSKLLIHEAQGWARARGNRFLHLGGGRGSRSDDSLFRFKALFSSSYHPFHTCRWILDQSAYDDLTAERHKHSTKLRCGEMSKTYFPAYRAPFQIANVGDEQLEEATLEGAPDSFSDNADTTSYNASIAQNSSSPADPVQSKSS
jgi:sugar O-acyltransferase (sialic acid O-acetyltransferase NeuD family)